MVRSSGGLREGLGLCALPIGNELSSLRAQNCLGSFLSSSVSPEPSAGLPAGSARLHSFQETLGEKRFLAAAGGGRARSPGLLVEASHTARSAFCHDIALPSAPLPALLLRVAPNDYLWLSPRIQDDSLL